MPPPAFARRIRVLLRTVYYFWLALLVNLVSSNPWDLLPYVVRFIVLRGESVHRLATTQFLYDPRSARHRAVAGKDRRSIPEYDVLTDLSFISWMIGGIRGYYTVRNRGR